MGPKGSLANRLVFLGQALRASAQVGAIAGASRALARAVAAPIRREGGERLTVAELGAGTGELTRAVLERLEPGDSLDLYEINPEFVNVLRADFPADRDGLAISIKDEDVESLPADGSYDVIVSSLPILYFPAEKAERVYAAIERSLRPGGLLVYYDYCFKEISAHLHLGEKRRRYLRIIRAARALHERNGYERRLVPWNLPPARIHVLRRPAASKARGIVLSSR